MMAHAQKPDFFFRRNERVHSNRRGRQFSQLLAAEVCVSAVVMLDTPYSEVVWRVLATHSIRQFPLHLPSRASPCAIRFQLESTTCERIPYFWHTAPYGHTGHPFLPLRKLGSAYNNVLDGELTLKRWNLTSNIGIEYANVTWIASLLTPFRSSAWNMATTGRISMNCHIWTFYYTSSSSIGTATLVGFGLLNYRWVFSAGRFLQSAVASGTSNPPTGRILLHSDNKCRFRVTWTKQQTF
jgi:hypothetical protein